MQTPKKGAESVKKPKIKLTTTPKANGTDTPKSTKAKKETKPKAKKANGAAAEPAAPVEPELDPETKRKNKEVINRAKLRDLEFANNLCRRRSSSCAISCRRVF